MFLLLSGYEYSIYGAILFGLILFIYWAYVKRNETAQIKQNFQSMPRAIAGQDRDKALRMKIAELYELKATVNGTALGTAGFTVVSMALVALAIDAHRQGLDLIADFALISAFHLGAYGLKTGIMLRDLVRFRRRTGRLPALQDLIALSPDTPITAQSAEPAGARP